MNMNLRDLQYLITLAQTKHFGRAAEKCFVSQPTLSMQLKKLEDELGVPLIERAHKSVLLTHAGEKIVEKALLILQEVKAIKEVAKLAQDPLAATLHLGLIPTIGPYLLPRVLADIKKQMPQLELYLHEEKTDDALNLLQQGKLDAAILALPVVEPGLEVHELYEEKFLVTVSAQHPLAKVKKITLEHLQQEKILLLAEGHCLREQALEVCHIRQAPTEFAATSLETLRYMVASGHGVTLLPELACDFKNEMLEFKHLPKPEPYRTVGLVFRQGSSLLTCLDKLAQVIKSSHSGMFV